MEKTFFVTAPIEKEGFDATRMPSCRVNNRKNAWKAWNQRERLQGA